MNPNDRRNRSDFEQQRIYGRPPHPTKNNPQRPTPSHSGRPPQGRPPVKKSGSADDIMRKSYLEYKKTQRRRKKTMMISAVVLVAMLAVVAFVLLNISCTGSDKKESQTSESTVSQQTRDDNAEASSDTALESAALMAEPPRTDIFVERAPIDTTSFRSPLMTLWRAI